jgi:hypothetical protein
MGAREAIAKVLAGRIKAYHSSPHDFDKFDISKIGTGEGAQAYGHGIYFAENPAVSGQGGEYWKYFHDQTGRHRFPDNEHAAATRLFQHDFDRAAAIEKLQRDMEISRSKLQGTAGDFHRRVLEAGQAQLDLLASGKPVGPRTYEVNIAADPAHMLDWDKPWQQQGEAVQRVMGEPRDTVRNTGQVRYKEWARDFGDPTGAKVSSVLRDAGIPGIKYLDEGSRGIEGELAGARKWYDSLKNRTDIEPEGIAAAKARVAAMEAKIPTSNYVVFDPSIVDITKKYGLAGAAAVPTAGAMMGSAFDQGAYPQEEVR